MEEGGSGAGQMLGVHNERMEQRGEKETQGRGASRHCSPSSEPWGRFSITVRTGSTLTPVFPPSLTDQCSAHSPCPRPPVPGQHPVGAAGRGPSFPCSWLDALPPHPTPQTPPAPGPLESSYSSPYVSTWFGISTTEVLKVTTEVPTQRRKDSFLTRGPERTVGP